MSGVEITGSAPHMRARFSVARMHRVQLVALSPVIVAAVVNTGHQYLSANGEGSPGAVDSVLAGLTHLVPIAVAALTAAVVFRKSLRDTFIAFLLLRYPVLQRREPFLQLGRARFSELSSFPRDSLLRRLVHLCDGSL